MQPQTDKLKISVVTVCYNAVKDLEKTILSVVDQTYDNIEYIIIDGGSTDGTIDIIKKYTEGGSEYGKHNVKIAYWVSEPDSGIYDAMNKGIRIASGDYILNINVGDQLINVPIEQLEMFKNDDIAGLAGKIIDEKDKTFIPRYDWRMKLQNQLPHQGLFYRLPMIREYNTQYKIVGDFDLNLEIYKKEKKIHVIEELIAYHDTSGISRGKDSAKESFEVIKSQCGIKWYLYSLIYRKIKAIKSLMC